MKMEQLMFRAGKDYKKEFVKACWYFRVTQREVFITAMGKVIKQANEEKGRKGE